MSADLGAIRISELLHNARVRRASDLHLGGGTRASLRIDGRLIVLDGEPIGEPALLAFLEARLVPDALRRLRERGAADGAAREEGSVGPYRIHAFRQRGGIKIAIRFLAETIPPLAQLGLPALVSSFAAAPQGLVLFTGPTGSGKTTALAALIDLINRTSERNIITIEDPIEYVHTPVRSVIAHCEVGRDTPDYAEALRGLLRADPDVILIGEMRDRETMAAALTAAETGHVVLATLHTNDTPQTIDRIVDSFAAEAQQQVRAQLAAVLVAVVGLRLLPRANAAGRRAATEVLIATDGVRNLIREGKTHQLRNAMVTGRKAGMQTLESDLNALVARGEIALASAQAVSTRPHEIVEPGRGAA